MRATRVGGSFSSARACGATKLKRPAKPNSIVKPLLPVSVIVFMTDPLFSSWDVGRLGPLMRRSSRWERDTLFHLWLPSGRTPQWERSCPRRGFQQSLEETYLSLLFLETYETSTL